jgi:hypothetical protein
MNRATALVRYAAVVGFSVALSIAAGPVGRAEPTGAGPGGAAAAGPSMESAVVRLHDAVAAAQRHDPIPEQLQPSLEGIHGDVADVGKCDYSQSLHRLCRRGFTRGSKVLVLLGDSHARHWIPAFESIAKRTKYAAYYLVKPGCTAASVTPARGQGAFVGCVEWRRWAIAAIGRLQPDVLVLSGAMPAGVVARDGRTVTDPADVAARMRAGLVRTVQAVRHRVGRVFIVADAPGLAEDSGSCLREDGADLSSCASPPSTAAQLHFAAVHAAARSTVATLIDSRPWFCWQGLCPAVVGTTVTYRDGRHLTTVYSRSLEWPLQHAMRLARLGR